MDLSIDPSKRGYGSLWGVRPDWINYGAVGFGRMVAPEAWLSTWSALASRAEISETGGIRVVGKDYLRLLGSVGTQGDDQDTRKKKFWCTKEKK